MWSLLVAAILGASFGFSPVAPLVLLTAAAIPLLFWRFPRACLYTLVASVCLFEAYPLVQPDSLTDRVPIFWNINTIVQTYAHSDFHGIPLNLLEILLLTAGFFSMVQAVYMRRVKVAVGPLAAVISFFTAFVLLGWVNGLSTGGDFNFSLLEIRPPLYFLFAYLMMTNLGRDEAARRVIVHLLIGCIAFKAVLYTYRLYGTMHGVIPDQGVGSHEEVFFFNAFFMLLLSLGLTGAQPRLRKAMWLLLPVIVTAHLACNRRSGVAELIIALPVLMVLGYFAIPSRRKVIGIVGVIMSIILSIYYPLYRNKSGMWAQPAQAIKSAFEPDARDASSDAYRNGENQNLMATIKSAPVQGFGFGKRMIVVADLSYAANLWEFWDRLPHNTLLWVWMRTGTIGFFAFWLMISAILIHGCHCLRDALGPKEQSMAMFIISIVVMWLVAGAFDMGFTQVRPVLLSGFAAGLLGSLARRNPDQEPAPSNGKRLATTARTL